MAPTRWAVDLGWLCDWLDWGQVVVALCGSGPSTQQARQLVVSILLPPWRGPGMGHMERPEGGTEVPEALGTQGVRRELPRPSRQRAPGCGVEEGKWEAQALPRRAAGVLTWERGGEESGVTLGTGLALTPGWMGVWKQGAN